MVFNSGFKGLISAWTVVEGPSHFLGVQKHG